VLHDDGRRVSVLGRGTSLLGVTLNKRACNLHASKWRQGVKVGDIVEVTVFDDEWHPSLVRAVQRAGPRAVLVVEPVFLGYTISVPLHSFKVRSPQVEHCELQSLLDMGLAFDDFNTLATNHPKYHPFGSLQSPGSVKPAMRFYYHDGTTSACWVVQAPCTLPDRLRLVRDLTGVLRFCLDCNLLPPGMDPVAPTETQRAKLGAVVIPLWEPPETSVTDMHVLSCALTNTLKEHLRHGDDRLAARLLDTRRDPLLTLCAFDDERESLAAALCAAARKPYGVDRVTSSVWQHAYGGRDYFVSQDLESLHASLKRLMTRHRTHNLNMQELVRLDVRVNMWRMYKKWYGRAHDLRQWLQRVQPVEVSLSPDSFANNEIKFDVHVNYGSETLYESMTGSERLHRVDSQILEHFTKYALGAHPSSDPPLDERAPAPAHSEWADCLQESFESMMKRVCARADSVVDAALHRERLPHSKLEFCLSRKIECEDGRTLFWNACEGVVEKLVVDSAMDDDPLLHVSVMTHPPPPPRQGGVLVHNNSLDKMNCVVDMVKTDRQRPGPADRGATIIYTAPTLLYVWHRRLTAAGVDAHVFHGSARRNQKVIDTMNRGDVIIAAWSALQCQEDVFHLARGDVPAWRAFVDEFDTSHAALASGIIRSRSRSTWLLCRRCGFETLALALPLLGVRPFCFRSGWNQLSALQSNFAQRRHVHAMINHRHVQGARDALLHLCRTLVLCQAPSAPVALVLQRANHACPSAYAGKHADALQKFGQKILRDSRKHSLALRSSSFLANMVKRITMTCWGVMPPFHLVADRIGFGRYATDAGQHLRAMTSVAEVQNSVQQESQKEARLLVHSLRDKKAVDAKCPICFENLSETSSETSCSSGSSNAGLLRTVVVGQCGHAVCGECADNIMRTAAENMVSGANDYGPTAPINSACCPICRHTWTAPAKRPLMLSTAPSTELQDVAGAVFNTKDCPHWQDLVEGNPMLESLKHLCDLLAPSAAGVHESGSTNIVVVCRSQELVSHLHNIVRKNIFVKNLTHKAYKISRSTTPKARGKALAEFAKAVPLVQLKILFVTASLVRGMVFHRTRHYVVVEDLKAKEAVDLKYAMHASLLTFPPEQRHTPVTAHTIVAPLCPGKDCAQGVARIAPTVMIPPARKGCIPTRPPVQRLDREYISRIHAFFGWPPHSLLRRHTSATVYPEPLPADAAIRLFDARLDALLALGSALGDNAAESGVALQEEPHSLRLLLENQPTTIVVPERSSRTATVSRSVHI